MYEQEIRDTWRTALGSGIPAAARDELTAVVAAAYDRYHEHPEFLAERIVPRAWRQGYRDGAAEGIAATGRLIRQMTDDPHRAGDQTARILRIAATNLEEGLVASPLRQAVKEVRSPLGLPEQLHWSRPGSHPLTGVALAAQAWRIGNATGIADGGVLAVGQFAHVRDSATLDGLPVRQWLDLALTPVHERYAAHHGVPAASVQMASVPARMAMQASPAVAQAIAGQARQLFGAAQPGRVPPNQRQVARAAFVDNPWSPSQINHPGGNSVLALSPESLSALPRGRERGGR